MFSEFVPTDVGPHLAVFKLHGSTSWYRESDHPGIIWKYPGSAPELAGDTAALIYPTQVKSQAVQTEPFATAYEYFRGCLNQAKLCIAIGFSFRDPVINEVFRDALRNSDLRFAIIEPEMSKTRGEQFEALIDKIGLTTENWRGRLQMIVGRFGDEDTDKELETTIGGIDNWNDLDHGVNMMKHGRRFAAE